MRGIMKKFAVLMLALASLGAMTGCDDDDDSVKVPAAVQDTFGRMFPGAGHVEWAGKQGYLVAEFREGGTDMQAWFDAAGKWYMTEEDYLTPCCRRRCAPLSKAASTPHGMWTTRIS